MVPKGAKWEPRGATNIDTTQNRPADAADRGTRAQARDKKTYKALRLFNILGAPRSRIFEILRKL